MGELAASAVAGDVLVSLGLGAGIACGLGATWAGANILPFIAYQWAYKEEMKEHVRKGGSTEGAWYFPGIEDLKPLKPQQKQQPGNIAVIFNTPKATTPQQPSGPNNPPAPPKP